MADLFDSVEPSAAGGKPAPLADRLRPKTFADVIGQQKLLGEEGALRVMLESGNLSSII